MNSYLFKNPRKYFQHHASQIKEYEKEVGKKFWYLKKGEGEHSLSFSWLNQGSKALLVVLLMNFCSQVELLLALQLKTR